MVAISQTKTVQPEVVSAIEKLLAQKQDTNHPIQGVKPWQPVATD
jgi:hypothetical protein